MRLCNVQHDRNLQQSGEYRTARTCRFQNEPDRLLRSSCSLIMKQPALCPWLIHIAEDLEIVSNMLSELSGERRLCSP